MLRKNNLHTQTCALYKSFNGLTQSWLGAPHPDLAGVPPSGTEVHPARKGYGTRHLDIPQKGHGFKYENRNQ